MRDREASEARARKRPRSASPASPLLKRGARGVCTVDPFDRCKRLRQHHLAGARVFVHDGAAPVVKRGAEVLLDKQWRVQQLVGRGHYGRIFGLARGRRSTHVAKVMKRSARNDCLLVEFYHEFLSTEELRLRAAERGLALDRWWLAEQVHLWASLAVLVIPTAPCKTATYTHGYGEPTALAVLHDVLACLGQLHALGFLHADVKPDNFLITRGESALGLPFRLVGIDVGRAVDVEVLPVAFASDCHVKPYKCPEMYHGEPWTFQIDAYGAAAIAFGVLWGEYFRMPVSREGGQYVMRKEMKRYWRHGDLWRECFAELLNGPVATTAGRTRSLARFEALQAGLAAALADGNNRADAAEGLAEVLA